MPGRAQWQVPESTSLVRKYPLDPESAATNRTRTRSTRSQAGFGLRLAWIAAGVVLWFLDLRRRRKDLSHFLEAFLLIATGLALVALAGQTDVYLHRGVETGSERPYVVQPSGRALSANVDFRDFAPEQSANIIQTLHDGGYGFVRQEFSWAQIEQTQGQMNWSAYDPFMADLRDNNLAVIAVIVDAPDWSSPGSVGRGDAFPPDDPNALRNFSTQLTSHYPDTIQYVQVWDQPNLAANWGGAAVNGESFRPYLSAAFYGARDGNPQVQIVLPELAVRSDVTGGLSDLSFLNSLYEAGASSIFDVVAVRLDGGTDSPDDRQIDPGRTNFSRAILYRELMVGNQDAGKPIWATSFGWNANNGHVTRQQQAEYVVRGLNRAWSEWPWMGLMVQWVYVTGGDDPAAGYAVLPNGDTTPLYESLRAPAVVNRSDVANTGFAPMDSDAVAYEGNWHDQHLQGRTFRTTNQTSATSTLHFQGTGLIAFIRSGPESGLLRIELDGELLPGGASANPDYWDFNYRYGTNDLPQRLVSGLDDADHTITITLVESGDLTLGGWVVERTPPFTWPIILLSATAAIVLFLGLRSMIYLVAIRAGHINRRENVASPALPLMPDWNPGRR